MTRILRIVLDPRWLGKYLVCVQELFFFDPRVSEEVAERHRDSFRTAQPFPHVVIDGLLPEDLLNEVVGEFPLPEERQDWQRADHDKSVKLWLSRDWVLGPTTRHLLNQFNSAVFVDMLEKLTGIAGLIPDPHYLGGGLHQIERGGFLKIHCDCNRHDRLQLDRRINALLYLNRDWQDDWGGHVELWDSAMRHKVRKIAPVFNRLLVFATTDTSYHGHPDPLLCPPDVTRRSLALFYYTNGRPAHERSAPHGSAHRARPGEVFRSERRHREKSGVWRRRVPPIAMKLARKVAR
jgi:Rps23 Pro-64 3,4-dihydroxylase Tpa1-like proline 4-hydroxylase